MKIDFTQKEMQTLSDALLLAIARNGEARKNMIYSEEVFAAMDRLHHELRDLNSKICDAMRD